MNIKLDSLIEEIENEHTEVINFLLSQRRRYISQNPLFVFSLSGNGVFLAILRNWLTHRELTLDIIIVGLL